MKLLCPDAHPSEMSQKHMVAGSKKRVLKHPNMAGPAAETGAGGTRDPSVRC